MNTKAQISDIDLTPDVDLTESRLDILPYKGIMDCNSPHVGGVLNNIYKKKTATLPEGFHKIVEYKGKVYAWKADTEPNIGCKVYDVTDVDNPVVVLDLNSGVAELDALGFHTVKRELYAKPTETYQIGCLEYNVNGGVYFHNPFKEDDVFILTNRGYVANYTIINNVCYIFKENLSITYNKGGSRYFSFDDLFNNITCITADSAGHTTISDISNKFLVLGERKVDYSYFSSITDEVFQICIENDYMFYEVGTSNDNSHIFKTLYNDDDSLSQSNSLFISIVALKENNTDYWTQATVSSTAIPHFPKMKLSYYHYNNAPVALAVNDKVITYDIDTILYKDFETGDIYYKTSEGLVYKLSIELGEIPLFKIVNNFIITNSVNSVYTSYNMDSENGENPFATPIVCFINQAPDATYDGAAYVGAGINEQWNLLNKQVTSLNFPTINFKIDTNKGIALYLITAPGGQSPFYFNNISGKIPYFINIYIGELESEYKYSVKSITIGSYEYDIVPQLQGVVFPSYSDGNTITPVDMFSIIKDSGNNQLLISNSENKAYISPKNLIGEPLFGYYNYTETFMDELFVLQTGTFGIDGDFIYSLQFSNSVLTSQEIVATVKDLKFLGAFPLMALFWSGLDKSIYIFTGDNNLKKLKEAYRINTVGAIYCDPARLTMFISTDIGLIILYQEQVFLLDYPLIEGENKIYYDNGKYIVDNDFIAFSPFENFESQSIRIKTEFYGESRMIKSVNDCVFVRITKNSSITSGTVKIKAYTLTEKTSESTEQIYSISEKNFDTSGQCLLQYQPQFQTGVGFAVELESDFPVAYMGISHQPEAIQQAPKGKQNVIATPISKPNSSTFKFE